MKTLRLLTPLALVLLLASPALAADAPTVVDTTDLETLLQPIDEAEAMSCSRVIPNAVDDTATTSKNTAVYIYPLSNDTATGLAFVGSTTSNGTTSQIGNAVLYTPNTGFTGTDSFDYVISGCLQCSWTGCVEPEIDVGTVTVTVTH